jgi:dihydrofolate synthase/folylpolyglutamate synthase
VAFEKAGIFRQGAPALCGDLNPPQPLLDKARELNCRFLLRGRDFDLGVTDQHWQWRGVDARGQVVELRDLPLLDLPMENAALALQAYLLLGLPWVEAQIVQALQATRMVGRLDRRQVDWQGKRLNLLLDVGHNPHAAEYLARRLASQPPAGKRLAVFGLLSDKDLDGVIGELSASVDHWAVAPLDSPRARPVADLREALQKRGASVTSYDSVAAALEGQCGQATSDDEIVLFGSFYCVAEALEWLARRSTEEAANGIAG